VSAQWQKALPARAEEPWRSQPHSMKLVAMTTSPHTGLALACYARCPRDHPTGCAGPKETRSAGPWSFFRRAG